MRTRSVPQLEDMDPLLRPILQAEDEAEAQRLLARLIEEHAQPLVRQIVYSELRSERFALVDGQAPEVHDLCSEVVLQLLSRLHDLRDNPNQAPIASFYGYVAAVTYNMRSASLRRKYPERQRVKNRLRYVINHDPRFAMWEDANGMCLCGLAHWKNRTGSAFPPQQSGGGSALEQSVKRAPNLRQLPPRALLDVLFSLSRQPVEIEELTSLIAKIWDIQDLHRVENENADGSEIWDRLPDTRANVDTQVERRMQLALLWKEISELRPRQRAALLLNLRDASGQDMLPLFILMGVACLSEIAASLEMPVEELAELWNGLPLDDATLAQRFGITRQQVINLRKSARERLARRMAKSW
jgi:RNA polymerase sigma factor (sigma-70 family)